MPVARLELVMVPRCWLKWYIAGVAMMCALTGLEHHSSRFQRWVRRGYRIKIERAKP